MTSSQPPETTAVLSPGMLTLSEARRSPDSPLGIARLSPSSVAWPRRVFAPLVDIGLTATSGAFPQYDLVSAAQSLGTRFFELGYVTGDQNGQPIFAGYRLASAWDQGLRRQIADLRRIGGDVTIVFGGANGAESELARVIPDVRQLAQTYADVVNAFGVRRIDFDIEESAADDSKSMERRARAIAQLQTSQVAAGSPLEVWFSLSAGTTGLTTCDMRIIESALAAGVDIGGVNVMAMNFCHAASPDSHAEMGDYVLQAAESVFRQLHRIFSRRKPTLSDAQLWARLGITPMIGQNDVRTQRFCQSDAEKVLQFARAHGVGLLSMWSLNRDAATGRANYDSTGIAGQPHEFTKIFAPYTQ